MAKKNANNGGSTSLPDPPTYDSATNKQAKGELDANAPQSAAALQGVDLSKYRQPQLVEALDRLTSFTYAGSLLLKPALKIMWRSALYQDADVRLQDLLSQLQGTSPITEPPTPSNGNKASSASASSAPSAKQQPKPRSSQPSRSMAERFVHFFVVGIPMAILVGLAYGVVNFLTCIFADVKTVTQTSANLFSQAKTDLNHYIQHPEARPTKDQAIEAWTQQIVQPYTQTIVKRKLGPFGFGFIATPISRVVQSIVRVFANSSATELQYYAKKVKGFDVFKDQSVQQS